MVKILIKDQTFIYRNLHRKCYSLKRDGLVYGYGDSILALDTTFKVSEKLRLKVVQTKSKNVHAGVLSPVIIRDLDEIHSQFARDYSGLTRISYNPYYAGNFFDVESRSFISAAEKVYLTPNGVFALNPK